MPASIENLCSVFKLRISRAIMRRAVAGIVDRWLMA